VPRPCAGGTRDDADAPAGDRPAPEAEILDLRDLEAPEPLQRILEASAHLAPGQSLRARTPRYPRMLFPHLEARGLEWEAQEQADGSALVHVRRPG
jgi:uncharacterized protein (DUF2249 family)